jgi:DNA processing protein
LTKQTTKYYIGLSRLKGVGDVLAKTLIAYCGSAERVFEKSERYFEQIPGIGKTRAKQIASSRNNALKEAEREMEFIDKHQISVLCFGTEQYPQRLIEFDDAPMVLYYKGSEVLNTQRLITIVGTRNISAYGKGLVSDFVAELQTYNVVIVSGLAHGVDVHVHKKCIELGIPTIGVLAHGLDRLYPAIHTSIAKQMVQNGGLLTDYPSGTNPDKENFPKRNRIVAVMPPW